MVDVIAGGLSSCVKGARVVGLPSDSAPLWREQEEEEERQKGKKGKPERLLEPQEAEEAKKTKPPEGPAIFSH